MAQNEPIKDAKKVVVELTMTVEQAYQVKWVGKGPNEPIGDLLKSGQLTNRDLAWAVNGSYNPQCREASRTLLANWLGQPATLEATLRYGPEVVTGTNYLKEQEDDRLFQVGAIIGLAIYGSITLALWLLFSLLQQFLNPTTSAQWIGFTIAALIAIGIATVFGFVIFREFNNRRKTCYEKSRGRTLKFLRGR